MIESGIFQRDAGLGGANLGAVAAIGAFIGIDNIFGIGGGDSLLRAFRQAGVAHDAVVVYFVGQDSSPDTGWRFRSRLIFRIKTSHRRTVKDNLAEANNISLY